MSVRVVHLLEVIDVDEQKRERRAETSSARGHAGDQELAATTIEQPRQVIARGLLLEDSRERDFRSHVATNIEASAAVRQVDGLRRPTDDANVGQRELDLEGCLVRRLEHRLEERVRIFR